MHVQSQIDIRSIYASNAQIDSGGAIQPNTPHISHRKWLKFRTKNARDCIAYMGGGIEMSSYARVSMHLQSHQYSNQLEALFCYSCATDILLEWWNELSLVENYFVCCCYHSYSMQGIYAFNIIEVWSFKALLIDNYMN